MTGVDGARIGVVGADVPRQVVLAAGATPVRLFGAGDGEASREARELLGAVDARAARILDEVLSGACDGLAGLVVSNDSAADLRLFYVLRVLAERGRLPFPVHLVDAPRGGGAPRERFVAWQYARLADFCAALTGHAVDAAALSNAGLREGRLGAALEALRGRRRAGACTGSAALDAYRSAATLSPEEAIGRVDAARGDTSGAVRIVVTGGTHPDSSVYEAIAREGLVVVGEDHDAGDAAWMGVAVEEATPDEAFAGLARAHAGRPPLAARSRSGERAAALAALVRATGARGVLALARELDDAPAWDERDQRAALRTLGVPMESAVRIRSGESVEAGAAAARRLRETCEEEA